MTDIEEINRRARDAIRKRQQRDTAIPLSQFARERPTELHMRWGEIAQLADAAREAVEAYEARFESISGRGNYTGPIDEQMLALKAAIKRCGESA